MLWFMTATQVHLKTKVSHFFWFDNYDHNLIFLKRKTVQIKFGQVKQGWSCVQFFHKHRAHCILRLIPHKLCTLLDKN